MFLAFYGKFIPMHTIFLPAAKEREVMLYETGLVDIEESFFTNL